MENILIDMLETKTCGICLKELENSEFTIKQNNCKSCRNHKAKYKYVVELHKRQWEKEWIERRTLIRNQLVRDLVESGWPIDKITQGYVKAEEFELNNAFQYVFFNKPDQFPQIDDMKTFTLNIGFADNNRRHKLRPLMYII